MALRRHIMSAMHERGPTALSIVAKRLAIQDLVFYDAGMDARVVFVVLLLYHVLASQVSQPG